MERLDVTARQIWAHSGPITDQLRSHNQRRLTEKTVRKEETESFYKHGKWTRIHGGVGHFSTLNREQSGPHLSSGAF